MAHTYEELKGKTLAELREVAAGMENQAVQGYTQMNKDRLLAALCNALNIDMHEHHQVVGVDKASIKAKIRELKRTRDEAIAARDPEKLHSVRRYIHRLKRALHKATV